VELHRDGDWILAVRLTGPDGPAASPGPGPGAEAALELVAADGPLHVLLDGVLHGDEGGAAAGAAAARRVLAAYRHDGESAIEQLRGTFATVVWDGERRSLLAARDPLGIHPLFWAEAGGCLYVSSSFAALRGHPAVGGDLHREVLAEFVAARFLDAQETVVRAIRRVPPGHVLRVSGTAREARRYWHPGPQGPEDWVTEDRLEEFDVLFTRAVDRCLARGPAGIFLSGGLDSVSVAAVARERSRRAGLPAPWALSLAFPGDANEEDVQRGVAAQLGLPQHMVGLEQAVAPGGVLGTALDLSRSWPAPLTNYWTPAYQRLARDGRERGCRVILTGTGGDEWLGVTPYYAADLLRRGDVRGLMTLWANLQRSYPVPRLLMARNLLWRFGVRDLLAATAARGLERAAPGLLRRRRLRRLHVATPSWIAPERALRRSMDERALAAQRPPSGRDLYWREMDEALDHPLTSLEVEETYESGRRTGVPVLQPFWDADLVRFLVRTPPELLNRGGRSKSVVRDMVARQVPGLGFERQRKVSATSVALGAMFEAAEPAWRQLGGVPCLGELAIVDAGLLESEMKRIVAERDRRNAYRLWYALTVEAWLQSGT
jgi:asparagine synthase (glutamine-hydrolysing)